MNSSAGLGWPLQTWWAGSLIGFHTKRLNGLIGINSYQGFLGSLLPCRRAYEQNPQSARRNNVPGEQISRRFLLLSGNLSASNYPGPAYGVSQQGVGAGLGGLHLRGEAIPQSFLQYAVLFAERLEPGARWWHAGRLRLGATLPTDAVADSGRPNWACAKRRAKFYRAL